MNLQEASKLIIAIQDELKNCEEGKEEIDGKKYTKVSKRVEVFRKYFGAFGRINTDILHLEGNTCVFKTTIELLKEKSDGDITVIELAYGHSRKAQGDSEMNKISYLEKTETGSIGRALANLGIGGDEFASMEEVAQAKAEAEANVKKESAKNNQKKNAKKDPMTRPQSIRINKYNEDSQNAILKKYEVEKISDLTKDQASEAINFIESGENDGQQPLS